MDIKEAIISAFKNNADKREMHYEEISIYIKNSISDFKDWDLEVLKKKVNAKLSQDLFKIVKGKRVENKESIFAPVSNGKKNKKGKSGRKAGVYSLRTIKKEANIIAVKQPKKKKGVPIQSLLFPVVKDGVTIKNKVNSNINQENVNLSIFSGLSTSHVGKCGEFAVISELLFRGFNANTTVVDDGIDIVCSKGNKFYLIQVKTTEYKGDLFSVKINKDSFDRYNEKNTYYIIVLRYINKSNIAVNQYLVFMASEIQKFIETGHIAIGGNTINLKFKSRSGDIFMYNGNKEQSVGFHLDKFDWIK
jgi:hypothetical protein